VKQHWERIVERIDALSLRERGLVFFSLALVVLALLYSALLRPVMEQQRIVTRSLSQQESQIRVANQQLGTMIIARREDPDAAARRRLDELKRRIAETQQALAQRQSTLITADRMAGLLEDLVARNRNLELVDLKSLPPTRIGTGAAAAAGAKPAAAVPAGAGEQAFFRHGVEVTVQGGYFDLLEYVRQLERLPTQLLWGRVDLSVGQYPKVTMKLTLYTLSLDRAWLVV
jgi:MSHA biogenesis protein MshJ